MKHRIEKLGSVLIVVAVATFFIQTWSGGKQTVVDLSTTELSCYGEKRGKHKIRFGSELHTMKRFSNCQSLLNRFNGNEVMVWYLPRSHQVYKVTINETELYKVGPVLFVLWWAAMLVFVYLAAIRWWRT
ncbi:MAG: hypothetical protein AAGG55_09455 [Pseudomonadota bacterium]